MTVGDAKRMWSRSDGSYASPDGRKYTLKLTEGYTVKSDPDDRTPAVFFASGLPRLGDYYPGTRAYCVDIIPKRKSPVLWVVDAKYEGETGPADQNDDPINEPPTIKWNNATTQGPIDEDWNGNPIATVLGEPMNGAQTTIDDLVLTVGRNFLTINLPGIHQYLRSTNSDVFAGFGPGTGRLTKFDANHVIAKERPSGYWRVNASIEFRYPYRTTAARAWWIRMRHEGFYARNANGQTVRAIDKNKEPTVKPVLLKLNGEVEPNPALAQWLEFQQYGTLPYSGLGLL